MARKRLPSIPSVPSQAEPTTRTWMQAVKEVAEIVTGQRGDKLDSAVTWRDMLDKGFATRSGLSYGPSAPDLSGVVFPTPDGASPLDDTSTPPAPGSVSISATTTINFITWTNPDLLYISHVEVYRSALLAYDDPGPYPVMQMDGNGDVLPSTGSLTGTAAPLGVYADKVEPMSHYVYWIRFVSYAGLHGPWASLAGTVVKSPQDPALYLELLSESITSGELASDLSTPIALIPGIQSSASASADWITTVQASHGANLSSITSNASAIAGINAKYNVKLDVDGYVSGFGLISSDVASTAIFNVDTFAVGKIGKTGLTFVVDGTKVVMDGAYIKDATITDAHITNLAVGKVTGLDASFVTANVNSLAAGKITAGTLTADISIGTGGLLWAESGAYKVRVGSHAVTGGTAMFSFTNGATPIVKFLTDGTAEFTGKVVVTAGSTGIGSFSDAGALATEDEIAWADVVGHPTSLYELDEVAKNQLDNKAVIYFQDDQPSSTQESDYWVDTNDGNKLYKYNGSAWVDAGDNRIAQAIVDAQTAQTTADGKAVVYFDDNAPYGASEGDLWKKPGGAVFRHDGSADWDINTLVSDDVYVSIGSGSATPSDCYVSPDGHHLFVLDSSGGLVNQSYLPTANSLVGRTFVGSFSVAAQETTPNGLTFKPDGTKMYIVGSASDQVRQYSLTTAWTITSGVTLEKSIAAPGSFSSGLDISADGTKMLVADTNGVYMMSLPTAWDIEGATQSSVKFFSPLAIRNGRISPDANVLYLHSLNDDTVYQYSMPGGNIALATQTGLFYFGAAASHLGGCFSHDGLKYFNADNGNDRVNQFSVASPWKQIATENNHYNQIATPTGFKGDTWYKTDSQEFYTHDGTAWNKSATVGATWGTDITGQPANSEILNSQQQWVQVLGKPSTLAELDAVAATQLDNKAVLYYQDEPPAGELHDYWIDTNDGNKLYHHNGTTWVEAGDNRIVQAIDAAQDAQTTADGKAVVFFGTVEPVGASEGDLWKQTGGTKHLYRKNAGAGWSVVSTENKIFHQEASPTGTLGDMWYKPSTKEFKQHNGSIWQDVADVTSAKTSANTSNVGGLTAAAVVAASNAAAAGLASNGDVQRIIKGNSLTVGAPADGLNLTGTAMGYYHAASGNWKTYFNNLGHFYCNGDGANNYLHWNGSTLAVRGDIRASSVTAGAIDGQVITGATLKTAATGRRVEIAKTDNRFTLYDASNVPRVTIDDSAQFGDNGFIEISATTSYVGIKITDSAWGVIATGQNAGFSGFSPVAGVKGTVQGGGSYSYGVHGYIASASGNQCAGVMGHAPINNSTHSGVKGEGAGSAIGVFGVSASGYGVYGRTNGASGTGVYAEATVNSGTAIKAVAQSGTAGHFTNNGSNSTLHAQNSGIGSVIYAINSGTGTGITATATSADGVRGVATSGRGLKGEASTGQGVMGTATTGNAGHFTSNGSNPTIYVRNNSNGHAVLGDSVTGYGVIGYSAGSGMAAVYGVGSGGTVGVAGTSVSGRAVQGVGTGSGSIGLYGQGVAYGAYIVGAIYSFTGAHDCLLLDGDTVPEVGDIVETVSIVNKASVSDAIPRVRLATTAESKKSYGAFVRAVDFPEYAVGEDTPISVAGLGNLDQTDYETIVGAYSLLGVNGVGEGQINVCSANGDLEDGDFICTSNVPGKGQRYDGFDMRVVVAKCREDVIWANEPGTTKMVACTYMCA